MHDSAADRVPLAGSPPAVEPATQEDEAGRFLADNPDIESVDLLIGDINGQMRGKWGPAEAIAKVNRPGVNLPLSIFGLDIWGREVEATGLYVESGDVDGYGRAIPGRINRAPWALRPTAQVLMSMVTEAGEPFFADPRNALKAVAARFNARGLCPVVAFELEFYLVDPAVFERSGRMAGHDAHGPDRQNMYSLTELRGQSDLFAEIRAAAALQNLPIDTIVKEAAPGQFEVNLKHRRDPLAAADDTVLLRRLITECAHKHGLRATFMAKPFLDWPGNGMHVHCSLIDCEGGGNVFAGQAGDVRLRHAAAGLLSTMRDTLLLYLPGFNGYRRLQPGSYAPTRIAWGRNNRSVAVRVPVSDDSARRLEHRLSGADANPYFVLAGVLGGMLEGLEAGELPPPPVEGNAYDVPLPQLSDDMDDAIEDFERSDFIRRLLGVDLRRIYAEIKKTELVAFDNEITPLERSTYL